MINRISIKKIGLAIALLFFSTSFLSAFHTNTNMRNIDLSGLVVDAMTLAPIEGAEIYDGNGIMLATTDSTGYYNVSIKCNESGKLTFKLKIEKEGFRSLHQHENWADLPGGMRGIMYFGLQAVNTDKVKPFSTLSIQSSSSKDLSYQNVLNQFLKVKEDRTFLNMLRTAIADNEKVFLQIEGKYYLVNNTGWIQLQSETDLVSIDNSHILPANQLNAVLKRKDIKGMTPLDTNKDAVYAIYTYENASGNTDKK